MNEVSLSAASLPAIPTVRAYSNEELLCVWERGQGQSPVEQALTMLVAACPENSRQALATLSIGQRDTCLLDLRQQLFGTELSSLADCPGCGERLEMNFRVSDIRAPATPPSAQPLSIRYPGKPSTKQSDYEASFRLPNSLDLMSLPVEASLAELRIKLFERCLIGVRRPGAKSENGQLAAKLPSKMIEAAIEQMAEADAQADVRLGLTCPCCERRWKATFDIVSYLWSEVQERATQLMREIHALASAYGWSEAEILALSSWRRQTYLTYLAYLGMQTG